LPLACGRGDQGGRNAPGPPVLATLLAEVYGPDEATRQKSAKVLEQIFKSVPFIVDTDNSFGTARPTLRLVPDSQARPLRLAQGQVLDSMGALMGQQTLAYVRAGRTAIRCRLRSGWTNRSCSSGGALATTPVAATPTGQLLSLGELVDAKTKRAGRSIFRRDGRGDHGDGRYGGPL
jgi:multidrug efflux pump subunit AcrB